MDYRVMGHDVMGPASKPDTFKNRIDTMTFPRDDDRYSLLIIFSATRVDDHGRRRGPPLAAKGPSSATAS